MWQRSAAPETTLMGYCRYFWLSSNHAFVLSRTKLAPPYPFLLEDFVAPELQYSPPFLVKFIRREYTDTHIQTFTPDLQCLVLVTADLQHRNAISMQPGNISIPTLKRLTRHASTHVQSSNTSTITSAQIFFETSMSFSVQKCRRTERRRNCFREGAVPSKVRPYSFLSFSRFSLTTSILASFQRRPAHPHPAVCLIGSSPLDHPYSSIYTPHLGLPRALPKVVFGITHTSVHFSFSLLSYLFHLQLSSPT